ncbi:MAG TPA: SMC-Scp complex subunit ScpB [Woeseiaceae bacterium]|nr:SMC-Scp complex subunit ScpB [Woeseiaceae bacterium]
MDEQEIKYFVEAALLAAGRPLSIENLQGLFDGRSTPEKDEIRQSIASLNEEYEVRGLEIGDVASGFRMQIKASMADRLQKLWEERPPRYSRALFETLALIAYRQPITRGEIEEVRGVSVSSNIMRTLLERDWVRVVGHRDVPGRPAMFGTTRGFLDYFNLKKLDDLPELADLSDWESLRVQLDLPEVDENALVELEGEVTALPVLYPQVPANEEMLTDGADVSPADNAVQGHDEDVFEDDIPELLPGDATDEVVAIDESELAADELVVSEWPDPLESGRG